MKTAPRRCNPPGAPGLRPDPASLVVDDPGGRLPPRSWAAARKPGARGPGHYPDRLLARAARHLGARLVQVSTDFVFDGRCRRPYREEDPPAPLSVYGHSKREGEEEALRENPDTLILRTSWLFGGGEGGFWPAILARARRGEPLRVVTDQVGSPTGCSDLAGAILRLLTLPVRGILHFANAGACSRYDFALAILAEAGLSVPVEPIATRLEPGRAVRPAYSALDTSRWRDLTGAAPRGWRRAVRDHLREGTARCGS